MYCSKWTVWRHKHNILTSKYYYVQSLFLIPFQTTALALEHCKRTLTLTFDLWTQIKWVTRTCRVLSTCHPYHQYPSGPRPALSNAGSVSCSGSSSKSNWLLLAPRPTAPTSFVKIRLKVAEIDCKMSVYALSPNGRESWEMIQHPRQKAAFPPEMVDNPDLTCTVQLPSSVMTMCVVHWSLCYQAHWRQRQ